MNFYKKTGNDFDIICVKNVPLQFGTKPIPQKCVLYMLPHKPVKNTVLHNFSPCCFKDVQYLMPACQCFKHISNCVPRNVTLFVSSPWPSSNGLLVWLILIFPTAQWLSTARCYSSYCILHIHVSVSHMGYFKKV